MLDTETKRRIDTARDILVGKVPDPKSQVEQITIALIYKFMDDMDKEVEELGGKHTFFKGEFAKYSWSRIFDPRISGHELVTLYGEAIDKMNLNPNIPQLFRDIFKNAYLPYRDPETLKSFLKIINEFNYSHSEKLGDVYEYLLSIMDSQGDAGQFRTPRHIIDFIVEVVSPQKTDKILDPACGTAGFLISSYKQILKDNTKKSLGDNLKPEERNNLIKNFCGFDISPDMIRMSLVNLYLHGFSNPKIYEYDTLTSEDRWNEYYDVILANPPFMSPKGGIKPHKRFSIQANRSEVLFVDYICEHLTPMGKAGIIVPEGIIFQSGNAYKQLRKMLVEIYLWAVVSLPAGIFQPYSGVKTSILLIDKQLNKKSDNILFVKIENEGFDLGAQRREIDKNDLPESKKLLLQYKETLQSNKTFSFENYNLLLITKESIASKKDYYLSIDRYRINESTKKSNFEMVMLKDICEIKKGASITKRDITDGNIPVIAGGQQPAYFHNIANRFGEVITVSSSGAYAGYINFFEIPIFASDCTTIQPLDKKIINCKYLFYLIKAKQEYFYSLQQGGGQPHVYGKDFGFLQIPLPPLSFQLELVNKIESYQSIINGARQVVENYKPQINIAANWDIKLLSEVCEITTGKLNANQADENGIYPFFTCSKDIFRINKYAFDCEAILLSGNNASGDFDVKHFKGKFNAYQRTYIITIKNGIKLDYELLKNYLENYLGILKSKSIGGLTKYLTLGMIQELNIPLPPLEEQKQIVSRIEQEQKLIDANKELIILYDQKIKDEINKVWEK